MAKRPSRNFGRTQAAALAGVKALATAGQPRQRPRMNSLDRLDAKYQTILCDIWGVIHDGGCILPGVEDRLLRWKSEGRRVILLTNAPRPAVSVQRYLDGLQLTRDAYDAITTSGEAGIAALTSPPRSVGFLGSDADRDDLAGHGVRIISGDYAELACTGLNDRYDEAEDYREQLAGLARSGVVMHCLNPDRVVIHRGRREACAGALADIYEELGGHVRWYGKPHGPIYDHARALAGNPPLEAMLAVGDGLPTDMLGAARFGIDAIYVSHGIHAGEPVPDDFAERHGLGEWRPILTVEGLA